MPSKKSNESKSKSMNGNENNKGDDSSSFTKPSPLHGVSSTSRAIQRDSSRSETEALNRSTPSTSHSTPSTSHSTPSTSCSPSTSAGSSGKCHRSNRECRMCKNKITLKEMIEWGKYFQNQDAAVDDNDNSDGGSEDHGQYDVNLEELNDLESNFGGSSDEEDSNKGTEEGGIGDTERNLLYEYGFEEDFDAITKATQGMGDAEKDLFHEYGLEEDFDAKDEEPLCMGDAELDLLYEYGLEEVFDAKDEETERNHGQGQVEGEGQLNNENNAVEVSTEVVYEPVDIDGVPPVPEQQRCRAWMKTPTPASTLNRIDILVQESELLRVYQSLTDIETATPVGDVNNVAAPCTICKVNAATRTILPCGHFLCVECMTYMIMNRCLSRGVPQAKECAACKMAVGSFVQVNND